MNHYYFLNEEFLHNDYIRKNFKIKVISHTDYALTCKLCSIFFVIKRTSENCYQVASVSNFKTEFKSFKKACSVMHYVEDLTRCVEMLEDFELLGIDIDLTGFSWTLIGFTEYMLDKKLVKPKPKNDEKFKKLQEEFHRDLYFREKFSSRFKR